jgi:hypothetical protein
MLKILANCYLAIVAILLLCVLPVGMVVSWHYGCTWLTAFFAIGTFIETTVIAAIISET